MIFVTVGTTLPFDRLFEELDRLNTAGEIQGHLFGQIGAGTYQPETFPWTEYVADFAKTIREADLVIGHGGVGTVFECLAAGTPLIAVANPLGKGQHQSDLLTALSRHRWCRCCIDVRDLRQCLREEVPCSPYPSDARLAQVIWDELSARTGMGCALGGGDS